MQYHVPERMIINYHPNDGYCLLRPQNRNLHLHSTLTLSLQRQYQCKMIRFVALAILLAFQRGCNGDTFNSTIEQVENIFLSLGQDCQVSPTSNLSRIQLESIDATPIISGSSLYMVYLEDIAIYNLDRYQIRGVRGKSHDGKSFPV